jgi:hypothetical protein
MLVATPQRVELVEDVLVEDGNRNPSGDGFKN